MHDGDHVYDGDIYVNDDDGVWWWCMLLMMTMMHADDEENDGDGDDDAIGDDDDTASVDHGRDATMSWIIKELKMDLNKCWCNGLWSLNFVINTNE